MNWDNTTKEKILFGMSISSLAVGFGITIAGFCVPPIGEIHSTVLIVLGQCFVFAGAMLGYKLSVRNGVALVNEEIVNAITHRLDRMEQKAVPDNKEGDTPEPSDESEG